MHKAHRGLLLALVSLGVAVACAPAQATTLVEHNAEPFRASSELGGAPEFGRCKKTTGSGKYENLACTKAVGSGGNYEWFPAFGSAQPLEKVGFTTALKEGTVVTLETVTKTKVVCEGETSTGHYTGNKTVGGVVVTFSKCLSFGVPCESAGASEGTIVTSTLEGELGVEEAGAEAIEDQIGEELRPVGGTGHFATFSCAGVAGIVTGSAISPVASNAMKLTETVRFKATKGHQKPESFAGGPAAVLMSSFEGEPEQSGLTLQTINTNEEKLEVNSVA